MGQRHRLSINAIFFGLSLILLNACNLSVERAYYRDGVKAVEAKDLPKAVESFDKLVRAFPNSDLSLDGARQGAKAAGALKNYLKQKDFLRAILTLSKDPEDLAKTQRDLAVLYFEKIVDYESAIKEYFKLFELSFFSPKDKFGFRINISRSYFYLREFKQALLETEAATKEAIDDEDRFQTEALKGSILMAAKRMDEAILVFTKAIEKFPDKAEKDNLAVSASLCYEEKGDYLHAIEVLEQAQASDDKKAFVQEKIKRLKERKDLAPGARGPHK